MAKINMPPGYSAGSLKGRGLTFTWRDDAGQWHQATADDGAPFVSHEALEQAMRDHAAKRGK
jgi:hypothetical protein